MTNPAKKGIMWTLREAETKVNGEISDHGIML